MKNSLCMKKSVLYLSVVSVLLVSCGARSSRTQIPIEEEKVEYRPLVTDSAAIDSIANSGMIDHDAALEIPDIPKDKDIHMDATDDAVMEIMSGTGDGEMKE
jgi:hypothetical protein